MNTPRMSPAPLCTALACGVALISLSPLASAATEPEGFPKAGEAHHTTIAPIQEKTLDNGLRVIAAVRPGLPIFVAEVIIKSGAETDPPKLGGLAHLTADVLNQGTKTRTAPQIASEVEALGAKLETEGHWDSATVKLTGLSDYTAPGLAILADVIKNPTFAKEEVERVRRQTMDVLKLGLDTPGTVARMAVNRVSLGNSPYAHPETGTLGSLARITRKDIVALHQQEYRPSNAILVVSGPLAAEEIFAEAAKAFGDWKEPAAGPATPSKPHSAISVWPDAEPAKKSAPAKSPTSISVWPNAQAAEKSGAPAASDAPKPRSVLIDMPTAGQAAVYIGCSSIPRDAADYYAGKVANALLGGGYSSWLNQEVRVKRGLSYGAASGLETHRSSGLFLATAQTKNESAAEVVNVMRTQVDRLGNAPAAPEYIKTRQAVLTGAFARDLETNDGYVKRLAELALYGLPLDTMDHTVESIEAVDAEAIRAFSEHHLPSAILNVVVAGSAKQALEPLKKLIPQIEVIPQNAVDYDSLTLKKSGHK